MTFRLFAHLGWHHLPLEEMLLVGRQPSSFSSFPVLVLPCAFSDQTKSAPRVSQRTLLACSIASKSCSGCLTQSASPSNVQGGRACVTRCTGTKCEPSKLVVCFGQKTNCVRFVFWTNLDRGAKKAKHGILHMHVMIIAKHHFCKICSKRSKFWGKKCRTCPS